MYVQVLGCITSLTLAASGLQHEPSNVSPMFGFQVLFVWHNPELPALFTPYLLRIVTFYTALFADNCSYSLPALLTYVRPECGFTVVIDSYLLTTPAILNRCMPLVKEIG